MTLILLNIKKGKSKYKFLTGIIQKNLLHLYCNRLAHISQPNCHVRSQGFFFLAHVVFSTCQMTGVKPQNVALNRHSSTFPRAVVSLYSNSGSLVSTGKLELSTLCIIA